MPSSPSTGPIALPIHSEQEDLRRKQKRRTNFLNAAFVLVVFLLLIPLFFGKTKPRKPRREDVGMDGFRLPTNVKVSPQVQSALKEKGGGRGRRIEASSPMLLHCELAWGTDELLLSRIVFFLRGSPLSRDGCIFSTFSRLTRSPNSFAPSSISSKLTPSLLHHPYSPFTTTSTSKHPFPLNPSVTHGPIPSSKFSKTSSSPSLSTPTPPSTSCLRPSSDLGRERFSQSIGRTSSGTTRERERRCLWIRS